jgi:hypothetical protein
LYLRWGYDLLFIVKWRIDKLIPLFVSDLATFYWDYIFGLWENRKVNIWPYLRFYISGLFGLFIFG